MHPSVLTAMASGWAAGEMLARTPARDVAPIDVLRLRLRQHSSWPHSWAWLPTPTPPSSWSRCDGPRRPTERGSPDTRRTIFNAGETLAGAANGKLLVLTHRDRTWHERTRQLAQTIRDDRSNSPTPHVRVWVEPLAKSAEHVDAHSSTWRAESLSRRRSARRLPSPLTLRPCASVPIVRCPRGARVDDGAAAQRRGTPTTTVVEPVATSAAAPADDGVLMVGVLIPRGAPAPTSGRRSRDARCRGGRPRSTQPAASRRASSRLIGRREGDEPSARGLRCRAARAGVDAIIGPASSTNTLGRLGSVVDAGVVACSTDRFGAGRSTASPTTACSSARSRRDSLQAAAVAKRWNARVNSNAVVVYIDDAYGQSLRRNRTSVAAARRYTVAASDRRASTADESPSPPRSRRSGAAPPRWSW